MMLKEGQVFVKANAIKTRGKGGLTQEKNKARLSEQPKQKRFDPSSRGLCAAQKRKDVAK